MSGNNQDDLAEYNLDGALVKSLNLNAASSAIGSLASMIAFIQILILVLLAYQELLSML